ncbi:WD40 repeat domain-containing protein, partial [Streptomyces sp. NPDC127038]|uniref:WD40 repeat domain-containing protein n=1 Tax=Streptomyces sp. NPDC127038 TaxID=3347114 RepID=UPI00365C30B5
MALPDTTGSYQELLSEQARELNSLKIRAGNPSLRDIEKRALALFADEGLVSLPPSTLSGMFNGSYARQDKLLWLVRTLMSWNRLGRDCTPPDNGDAELDVWYERWEATTKLRRHNRARSAPTNSPISEDTQTSPNIPQQPRLEPARHTPAVRAGSVFEAVQTFPALVGNVIAVAFSPDGALLAISGTHGAVQLWNPATQEPVGKPLTAHSGPVTAVAFSPNGTLLAAGGGIDGAVQLWNPATQEPVGKPLTGPSGEVIAVAFSPDGTHLATSSTTGFDGTHGVVWLWNLATQKPVGKPLTGHSGEVIAVAFSPDGTLLATGGTDSAVQLWNPATQEPVGKPLTAHSGPVTAVAFSPNGTLLAAGGGIDGAVQLWNPATQEPVGKPLTG